MEVQVTPEVRRFLAINRGDGDGSGYGDGDGSGYCYGSGDGDGDGSGYGDGDGSGYGSGYGDGSGDGSGSGYGDGIKMLDGKAVLLVDDQQTIIERVRGTYAYGYIVGKDLTLTPCYIAKCGDFFAHGDTLKEAVTDAQAKYEENRPMEDRIADFLKEYPTLESRDTCAAFHRWHHVLTGSCQMGRDQFVKEHGLDMEQEYTVATFLEITRNAYGGDAIRQLAEAYGNTAAGGQEELQF